MNIRKYDLIPIIERSTQDVQQHRIDDQTIPVLSSDIITRAIYQFATMSANMRSNIESSCIA